MTLEEAQQLRWSFNQTHSKLFIEWADIRQETDGSYSLVVDRLKESNKFLRTRKKRIGLW
jgi:hypothetical protein